MYNKLIAKPKTITEQILFEHLAGQNDNSVYISVRPDRLCMQDATAQMSLLQFMITDLPKTAIPTSLHCDHLIEFTKGSPKDLVAALSKNKEVYEFLLAAAKRYGMDFWEPGSGIIHQTILENYAIPGNLIIGTDSHTPNVGGLCVLGIGVGGAEAVDAMCGIPLEINKPKVLGVNLKGKLDGWNSPKDVILKVLSILGTKGGTGYILEYFGEGVNSLPATGRATITNMGAETGATSSIFPLDKKSMDYFSYTNNTSVLNLKKDLIEKYSHKKEILDDPRSFFDEVIEIDFDKLDIFISGPDSPDKLISLDAIKDASREHGFKTEISCSLIGSCTNSSYEDISRAADIAAQALKTGIKAKVPFYLTPGSRNIKNLIEKEGYLKTLTDFGAKILETACGPCVGMWNRTDLKQGKNTIAASYNRNFRKRIDGNIETDVFLMSPELATLFAITGNLSFNPEKDFLTTPNGKKLKIQPPKNYEISDIKLTKVNKGLAINLPDKKVEISIPNNSDRLKKLKPFPKLNPKDFINMRLLIKIKGKCTTDHISKAGEWLQYRGNLDKISGNLLLGAQNAFTEKIGMTFNLLRGEEQPISTVAREYKNKKINWIIVAEENYGEGSSREHAAMEPRYLGCKVIIAKSFARIHLTNLKKQGILALTFKNKDDYEKLYREDVISLEMIEDIKPGKTVKLKVKHSDGNVDKLEFDHTYNEQQLQWLTEGSSLNVISKKQKTRD